MNTNIMGLFVKNALVLSAVVMLLPAINIACQGNNRQDKVSEFGKYTGYSEKIYDGSQRTSDYLTLSDGTRLAYDLIIPTLKGMPADKPLPVLFKYTPYGRAWTIIDKNGKLVAGDFMDLPTQIMVRIRYWIMGDPGRILDPLWRDSWLKSASKAGYIIFSVDRPGTGASFASPTQGSMETASKFENEVINWIVAQPWSDGNVGMYGDSQQAMVQFAAAAAGNPHLKAILPSASDIEIYQAVNFPGGVFNKAFASVYNLVPLLDKMATPVDGDPDGILLAQARASRTDTVTVQSAVDLGAECPFQDSQSSTGIFPWKNYELYPFIERINQSRTAVYMTVGWYDIFTADMFYWYNNLSVPKRLTVRPTDHSQVSTNMSDLNYGNEALRWLDYWLKGIDNGITAEPPIHYYVQDGLKKGTWQTSDQWPLASQKSIAYYFGQGKAESAASVNDGSLITISPTVASASDAYTVDYSTTTGTRSRWGAIDVTHFYPDLSAHDAKALTYTTPPLETNVEVTGHPVVHLWLSTAAPDVDAFVYLEVVDQNGKSTYLTEGDLRASHRKLGTAPYNNFGLPFQSHYQADQLPVPAGEPIQMVFSLLPTSYQFRSGSRIRITVSFADTGNFDTPILNPAPVVQILRDAAHPSYMELPFVEK